MLVVGLLGFSGTSVSPASADDDPSGPTQQGGGVQPQSDGVGDGKPAESAKPQQAGGGNLPGQKPGDRAPGADGGSRPYADAAPPVDPDFVDNYTRLWKKVERGKLKVRSLTEDLVAARQVLTSTNSDLAMMLRVRNRADFALVEAADQFDVAVKDMYITGTTDVDVVLGVMGSQPDDVLRTIDSIVYLRSATGTESADFDFAATANVAAQSAAASAMIRADEDRKRLDTVGKTLKKTKAQLARDKKELKKLIAAAAPQTVVGNNGCPKAVLEGTVPADVKVKQLCALAVKTAASPQAAFAIKWALVRLGAPYACQGIGRLEAWRYDCSSYVSRAYAEGAGLKTAGKGWAPSTRNMVPWDGAALDPHYAIIPPKAMRPGDLVLYDTCPAGEVCPYRHVVMYLGPAKPGGVPLMAHTNSCGDVAHVVPFTGTDVANFLGVRRVVPAYGEKVIAKAGSLDKPGKGKKAKKPDKPKQAEEAEEARERLTAPAGGCRRTPDVGPSAGLS